MTVKKKICLIESKTFYIEVDWVGKEKIIWIIERGVGYQSRNSFRARNVGWVAKCFSEAMSFPLENCLICSRKEGLKVVLFALQKCAR